MSILIKGMEMPKDGNWKTVRIYPDGTCAVPNWQGDCRLIDGAQAVPVPPHGDLISRDALADVFRGFIAMYDSCPFSQLSLTDKARRDELQTALAEVINAPTIIPAEEGE